MEADGYVFVDFWSESCEPCKALMPKVHELADKYGDKAGLTDDFQMIEVKRSDDDISATKVRQALLDNDKRTFDKLTPFGSLKQHLLGNDSIYEVLRRQINKVMNND